MATNLIRTADTPEDLERKMNEVNAAYNVFATQTHVYQKKGEPVFMAVFFIK